MYKHVIRPFLFLFDPEKVHNFTMWFFPLMVFLYPLFRLLYNPKKSNKKIYVCGLTFRNRLGLAAGLDKDGTVIRFWEALGFSHIEVGTVTPLPQPGNEKPRIFRLIKDNAILNRLGFNNNGADALKRNIIKSRKSISEDFIIGVNIGKNKYTPIETAYEDYKICLEKLYEQADYFTINISSPNTEELRKLQGVDYLDELLSEIQKTNTELSCRKSCNKKVIFLKIAPDLTNEEIINICSLTVKHKINGIIATNTTITREGLFEKTEEEGGLSGKPLKQLSDNVLKKLNELNEKNEENKIVLVGVGGVFDKKGFEDKLNDGAELVQIYTGFIYEGPGIIKKLLN
ncbi:MAG: quinone-dependent dihydroorotate dehydrogenase [Ignavibacteria bacterium]|nr:quinone-dependent dihydroorotate dehydrogenase [Ignavibacteria bacterium]